MFGFLKKAPPSVPPDRWQQHWHEMFDLSPPTENDAPWSLPLPELDSDYRLLMGLSWTTPEVRRRCFEVFPKGREMWERLEQLYVTKQKAISAEQAEGLLKTQLAYFDQLGIEVDSAYHGTKIGPDQKTRQEALSHADNLLYFTETFQGAKLTPEAAAASNFLHEPLYFQCNNSYYCYHWITWPLHARPGDPELYRPMLELWDSGWNVGVNDDEIFLYDARAEFGLLKDAPPP